MSQSDPGPRAHPAPQSEDQVPEAAPTESSDGSVRSPFTEFSTAPEQQGLYRPDQEKDACGLAVIATLDGQPRHEIVDKALIALRALEHRGAVGGDSGSGDGAGILLQIPDAFFREVLDFELPAPGAYAVGSVFLPTGGRDEAQIRAQMEEIAQEEGLEVLGWREVPVDDSAIGSAARSVMPYFVQPFVQERRDAQEAFTGHIPVQDLDGSAARLQLDQKAFRLRKRSQNRLGIYCSSFSTSTIVYKGMLTTAQLEPFYPDLSDERFGTRLAVVHSRFSTNTFPSWPLAQPMRTLAHNGEINTVKGNRNWMRARQSQLKSPLLGRNPEELFPICSEGASDSQSLDEVAELLMLSGRPLVQAMMMMIPEAWENHETMDVDRRSFYEYHSTLMEPWDGPAAVAFTDGRRVGSVLDRNGLRPGRFWETEDGLVVFASEVGVVDLSDRTIVRKGRVAPGTMFLVDTVEGRIVEDAELKQEIADLQPWQEWSEGNTVRFADLPEREHMRHPRSSIELRQKTFGYTHEELAKIIGPMAEKGAEPIYAMGTDTPVAVLAERPRLLFDYFVQSFAQVTNPPLDSIREELVTSMRCALGPMGNLLTTKRVRTHQVILEFPVINNDELDQVLHLSDEDEMPIALKVRGLYRPEGGGAGLRARIAEICEKVSAAVNRGVQYVVISDRDSNGSWAPIPSLLLTSAIHHHLLRSATRTKCSLVVEAGDVREVHHVALLLGYGASGVNPYLAMESAEDLVRAGQIAGVTEEQAVAHLIKALGKGVQKIMSKMGISTVSSYCGAQTFEALGLSKELIEDFFTGTVSQLDGVGLDVIAEETHARHRRAYPEDGVVEPHIGLDTGGEYDWRRDGAPHLFSPEVVFRLQHSTRTGSYDIFRSYTRLVDEQSEQLKTIRGLLSFDSDRTPVPLEEVEPVEEIFKRFSTGAMSYGSISMEAHETLAIAMNRIGAKSNTGEGGEDVERLMDPQRRSKIKQIASGRFGVTSLYLTNAEDLQIKMAQGAKPGEGGQLMAQKVYPWVARTRHSTPGVSLISPPPHHDIYSIEDLAQLIYDLKRSNPSARVHVKLVSELGIGTVASGVTKARADVVLVSGHDGGTGAAPLNSLKHAGLPWEIGLAETQQTLMLNGLRDRVVVQADGQMKTGRDVVIAALLGAEEYGFATAPLVVEGCIMMRKCHLDTCPVGVATQNPLLRERFTGRAEHVVNFFTFLAEEVRELLAQLGFRSLDEAIGHAEILRTDRAIRHWKAEGLDLTPVLHSSVLEHEGKEVRCRRGQDHELDRHFDVALIRESQPALRDREPVRLQHEIVNTDRSVGTMLGHEVTRTFQTDELGHDTIDITLLGQAGQSLGAFLPQGITLRLEGDANDYAGKGLSGGRIIIRPARDASFTAEDNVVAGNVIGYGATSGEILLRGQVGERFLVRNSGATAVAEGIGDHGCEYMTGGTALIIGRTGRNFGAGMSGGVAYVLDLSEAAVNLQSRTSGELQLLELDDDDRATVQGLLRRHAEETGSQLAQRLLDDLETTCARLTKVLPRDYSTVLGIRADAERDGLDPDGTEAWNQILEATTRG
ncbi:glutamate synthase large subunit [Kocuria palustris]|uniref:glutamate synthase large subunit n=1 Tax=Kocuria palustris TaxID=71999 RepID=UPI002043FD59|nr:glutamate synthase large subunit [Kocuria palustris]MCM3331882.1 glutamate synthase large subunit [Kocuria palustris]